MVPGGGLEEPHFTPDADGTVTLTASGGLDFVLEARSSCDDGGTTLVCRNAGSTSFPVVGGVAVFIVVETFLGEEAGPFTLTITQQ